MPPKALWSQLRSIETKLSRASTLHVASDFDGTLAPIVELPDLAVIVPRAHDALARLARLPATRLALVSGRNVADLAHRAAVPRVFLAGLLGIETRVPGEAMVVHLRPEQEVPEALGTELRRLCLHFPGAWVEPKDYTLAVHYRALPPALARTFGAAVLRRVLPYRKTVELAQAKKVYEIRPRGAPGKADTLATWLGRAKAPRHLVVFLGDDALDEAAHSLVHRLGGLAIVVGPLRSKAAYRLRDPEDVARFLEWLEERWRARTIKRSATPGSARPPSRA